MFSRIIRAARYRGFPERITGCGNQSSAFLSSSGSVEPRGLEPSADLALAHCHSGAVPLLGAPANTGPSPICR